MGAPSLYLGFFLAFWATPHMSYGHLLLNVSIYMLIAIRYEERDLSACSARNIEYRRRVAC
jgi:protein-S-isoprenylcysteine O-methyltransferase Ste14